MKVVSLPRNGLAPDAETMAEALETLAAAVRAGHEDMERAIVVAMDSKGEVASYAFGKPMSVLQGVGMLECAKMRQMQEPD